MKKYQINTKIQSRLIITLFTIGLLISSCSCSKKEDVAETPPPTEVTPVNPVNPEKNFETISGSFENLSATDSEIPEVCTQEVNLYQLNKTAPQSGQIEKLITKTTLDEKGQFTFKNISELNLKLSINSFKETNYLIEVQCGSKSYQRYLTGSENQKITPAIGLLSWLAETSAADTIISKTKEDWATFYQALETTKTEDEAYTLLENSEVASRLFLEKFKNSPQILKQARPRLINEIVPQEINEQEKTPLTAIASHWSKDYKLLTEWRVNNQLYSQYNETSLLTSADSQGLLALKLILGENDGSNNIDLSHNYLDKNYEIKIKNSIPPNPPEINSDKIYTNSTLVDLNLITGALVSGSDYGISTPKPINCLSFSKLALVEEDILPLKISTTNDLIFDILCQNENTQKVQFLLSPQSGPKKISIKAQDSSGVISDVSKTINMVLDQTPPEIQFISNMDSLHLQGGSVFNITWKSNELYPKENSTSLSYSIDNGVTWIDIATNLPINPTGETTATGIFNWTVPKIESKTLFLKLNTLDLAGNSSSVLSSAFSIDSTPPVPPEINLLSNKLTDQIPVQIQILCDKDFNKIFISESDLKPNSSDSRWQDCQSVTNYNLLSTNQQVVDGLKNIFIWSKDLSENVSLTYSSLSLTYDSQAPVISEFDLINLTGPDSTFLGGSQQTLKWKTSDSTQILYSLFQSLDNGVNYTNIAKDLSLVNLFKLNLPNSDLSNVQIKLVAKDELNHITEKTLASTFSIDTSAPKAVSIKINNSETTTGNKNIVVSFSALDNLSKITEFCIKYNSNTKPISSDKCWVKLSDIQVNAQKNLLLNNYPFQLGTFTNNYQLSVWYKNELNLISDLSQNGLGTVSVDTQNIFYNLDQPPQISNLIAASINTPSSPLTSTDTTIPTGKDVYIHWNIIDNLPLPNGSISLYYTTDESNYTLIASGVNNTNTNCTLLTGNTGCFKWSSGSPTASYYKIKLSVTDASGASVFELTNPLNTGPVKFLTGNTNLGIGAAATNAILFSPNENVYNDNPDNQSVAVTKMNYVFYKNYGRGLLYVSPIDGVIRDLGFQTGVSSGDNGSVFNASFANILRITLDYNDNLIIWDNNRVRKVDLSVNPWTITTLFGGGNDSTDGAPAFNAEISLLGTDQVTVTPNGRIYFNKSNEIWYYDPSDLKVKKYLALTGLGTDDMVSWKANFDNVICPGSNAALMFSKSNSQITKIMRRMSSSPSANCGSSSATYPYYNTNFNPQSGIAEAPHPTQTVWSAAKFTGLDGQIYVLHHGRSVLKKYNPLTQNFEDVVGTINQNGRCVDGTPALKCNAVIMSAFVNEFGKIYFVDLGVIRTIDSNGLVQSLVGQPRNFGIGYNPLSARFSQISFFEIANNDVYIKNEQENQIVKFSLTGGVLKHVAGNSIRNAPVFGSLATQTNLPNCSWGMPCGFIVDQTKQRLYHFANFGGIGYIDLVTGKWVSQIASGGFQDTGTRISYVGQSPTGYLIYAPSHYGVSGNKVTLRVLDNTNSRNTVIYGINSVLSNLSNTICVGGIGSNCSYPHTMDSSVQERFKFDTNTNKWLFSIKGSNQIYSIPHLGGTVELFKTVSNPHAAYDYVKTVSQESLFYCSTSGNLYKVNLLTNTETALPMPTKNFKCTSASLYYHSARNSLIFAYTQNNLAGVAEYENP